MNKDLLISVGIDYQKGLERFSNVTAMYEKYLMKFPNDPSFDSLEKAMDDMNVEVAFKSAHTLKGVAGNLSLKGLLKPLLPMVECLRIGDINGAFKYKDAVELNYKKIVEAINS